MHLNYYLQYEGDQRKDKYSFKTREVIEIIYEGRQEYYKKMGVKVCLLLYLLKTHISHCLTNCCYPY